MKEGKYRVSRVVTRTGDKGETGLADGSRLPKSDLRIEVLGILDELNATIGYLKSLEPGDSYIAPIENVQQTLFNIGAEIAQPGAVHLTQEHIAELESLCKGYQEALPPLREFVLPGGNRPGGWCHICRTEVRRAERQLVALSLDTEVNPHSLAYLNRLSDLFFILSRHINLGADQKEPQWTGVEPRDKK